jgi:acetylornithine deacetylase/succinyl-diaminopimelate desuccinylase-like protein
MLNLQALIRIDTTDPPGNETRRGEGGYMYGRGSLDDKSDLFAALMTMVVLKLRRRRPTGT